MNSKVIALISTELTSQQLALAAMQLVSGYSLLSKGGLMPSFEVVRELPHHILMKKKFFEKQGTLFSEIENGSLWGICYESSNDKKFKYSRYSKKYLKGELTENKSSSK